MDIDLATAQKVLNPSRFELIVLPTEQCNFRCTYCYEDFAIGRMSRQTVEGLKRLISLRASGTSDFILSWFGGEPLLAWDIILDVSAHALKEFSREGQNYAGYITTNAYRLQVGLFQKLIEVGIRRFQITLDGPKQVHDRRRLRRDGAGTFDIIWNNLIAIRELASSADCPWFEVSLRVHYDGASIEYVSHLVTDIIEAFSPEPKRFTVNLHELECLGGSRDNEIVKLTENDKAIARTYADRLSMSGLSTSMPSDFRNYICYAARANSLVIRADGRVSKCTVALLDNRNNVGQLFPDGHIEIYNDKLRPWLRGVFTGSKDELACPLVDLPSIHQTILH